jgi:hypothetical protein
VPGPFLDPPRGEIGDQSYRPRPCRLHPERVLDYPYDELPAEVRQQIHAWQARHDASYREVAMVPGWKVGGWPDWSVTDVLDTACHRCGGPTALLLVIDSSERDPHDRRWQPADDPNPDEAVEPTGVVVGRYGALRTFACSRCPDTPFHLDQQ